MIPLLSVRRELVFAAVISAGLHVGLATVWKSAQAVALPSPLTDKRVIEIETEIPREVSDPADIETVARHEPIAIPRAPDLVRVDSTNPFVMDPEPPTPYRPGDTRVIPVPDATAGPEVKQTVFEPKLLDRIPVAKNRVAPIYPFEERRTGQSGEVLVDFIVDAEGKVYGAHAVSGTNLNFSSAAVQALSRWHFVPGVKSGRPVATHMQVPIVFTLNDSERI